LDPTPAVAAIVSQTADPAATRAASAVAAADIPGIDASADGGSTGSEQDRAFMAEAIRLSRTHTGQTSTNPSVGCVVVKNGAIVGRGVTAVGGRPHAEPQALADAGDQARGATAYVTLEPCSHYGHTPPCANALVAAGVARVVISLTDPDPRVSGRGVAILEAAGIAVDTGVMAAESREALAGYLTRQTKHRPHVTLKLAVSADGMIGKSGAGQVAITGPLARAAVQQLRAETDAILIGIGTALADDPDLTCRIPGLEHRSPIRIVLDRNLDLPPNSKLATTAKIVPVIIVSDGSLSPRRGEGARRADEREPQTLNDRRSALESRSVEILAQDPSDLATLLTTLAARGISTLLVEGGAKVAKAFLDAHLVDRILLLSGPDPIGAGGIPAPISVQDMPEEFHHLRQTRFGPDLCDTYESDL
jgi:diaminohydroxyphosphoribosylaminopyrimidine deaminase/5-amino-6-(5-phosphoribosylamino)uracil reductase